MERHTVGISYTGTDGRNTSFNASSVDDALSRLNAIKGYGRTHGDVLAERAAAALSRGNPGAGRASAGTASTVPADPGRAYRHTTGTGANGNAATSFKVITSIERDPWGRVKKVHYGSVRSDGAGGITLVDGGSEGPGEEQKEVEEFYKNWSTVWQWYTRYGYKYRG